MLNIGDYVYLRKCGETLQYEIKLKAMMDARFGYKYLAETKTQNGTERIIFDDFAINSLVYLTEDCCSNKEDIKQKGRSVLYETGKKNN